jgi:hypothetical protein
MDRHQLPQLYNEHSFPQEPLRSAYIESIITIQNELFPNTHKTDLLITPGSEIAILSLVIRALTEATSRVNPSRNATNGTGKGK